MLIEWSDDYLLNIDQVDAQHKGFFEATHRLYFDILNCKGEEVVEASLTYLKDYADEHFRDEEVFMAKHKYPALSEHKKLHKDFIEKLDWLKDQFNVSNVGTQEMADDVLEMTQDWLVDHITEEDTKYAKFIMAASK
jgi:hemerythrin